MNDKTISAVMKHLRSRVAPANCARDPAKMRIAAFARWDKYRAKLDKMRTVRTGKKFQKNTKKD